jgi:hypothetical protein
MPAPFPGIATAVLRVAVGTVAVDELELELLLDEELLSTSSRKRLPPTIPDCFPDPLLGLLLPGMFKFELIPTDSALTQAK